MSAEATGLLQDVAERIIERYLKTTGKAAVLPVSGSATGGFDVDITYSWQGTTRRIKVKPDAYYGTDPAKARDRDLLFYRAESDTIGLESVANSATREPGWVFTSQADDLYYYRLAISQDAGVIRTLMNGSDEDFFSELAVERDELLVIPMAPARAWFEKNQDRFPSRPVFAGGTGSWYRLVPLAEFRRAVAGTKEVGPIWPTVAL